MDKHSQSEFEEALDMARSLLATDRGACSSSSDLADTDQANTIIAKALQLRPESAEAWILKCQILSSLNDDTAALAAIEMAIRIDSKSAEAQYWRGAILNDLNRLQDALKCMERCFRHLQLDDLWLVEDLYCEKAMILDGLGRSDDAVATYEEGLRRCPSSSLLKSSLAPLRKAKVKAEMQLLRGGLS